MTFAEAIGHTANSCLATRGGLSYMAIHAGRIVFWEWRQGCPGDSDTESPWSWTVVGSKWRLTPSVVAATDWRVLDSERTREKFWQFQRDVPPDEQQEDSP